MWYQGRPSGWKPPGILVQRGLLAHFDHHHHLHWFMIITFIGYPNVHFYNFWSYRMNILRPPYDRSQHVFPLDFSWKVVLLMWSEISNSSVNHGAPGVFGCRGNLGEEDFLPCLITGGYFRMKMGWLNLTSSNRLGTNPIKKWVPLQGMRCATGLWNPTHVP